MKYSGLSSINNMLIMFTGLSLEESINLQIGCREWSDDELINAIIVCGEDDDGERMIYIQEQTRRELEL